MEASSHASMTNELSVVIRISLTVTRSFSGGTARATRSLVSFHSASDTAIVSSPPKLCFLGSTLAVDGGSHAGVR